MSHASITITPVTPRIGAEIGNIALNRPLKNYQVEELHRALLDRQMLFFRD